MKRKIAYLCMEYGLDSSLPIYAGGLGILAGDYLKAAREEGFPLTGIGILWREDYTKQLIGEGGRPYDLYPAYDFDFLKDTGVLVNLTIQGQEVLCRIYEVDHFQNAPLFLLDCDVPGGDHGWITSRLYGGGKRERIAAEMVLGIGGIRALRALDIPVDRYHFNEGHAVFAGLELIREKMEGGMNFAEAWIRTRQEVVFTTHTPVAAGNEVHDLDLLFQMGAQNGRKREEMEEMGGDPFSMTVAGLRLSHISNGVSRMHGHTARRMWNQVEGKSPIISITNGVHTGTWQDELLRKAWEAGQDLWPRHQELKEELLAMVKEKQGVVMDPKVLTIGFARRAAPYKRSELIFRDAQVIDPLLRQGKIQLIFSGKAHPQDEYGKDIVECLVKMERRYRSRVVFLENYNMKIAAAMVKGCDVWLNNPRRPLEASGTSGMKSALNGGLNVSVVDGWMAEGPQHGVSGWLLQSQPQAFQGEEEEDQQDLKALYQVLFQEVVPLYYHHPERWQEMMCASIEMGQQFTSSRMIQDYYSLLYSQ